MTTNKLTRRALFCKAPTIMIGLPLVLAACAPSNNGGATIGVTVPLSSAVTAIQAFGQYLAQTFLPSLTGSGVPISNNVLGTISKIITGISGVANAVGTASSATTGSVLATIEGYVNQLAPVVQPYLSMIPGFGSIAAIAFMALPAIEGLVNMGATLLSPLVQQIAAAPVPAGPTAAGVALTPQQALQLLLQKTGRG